MNNKQKRLHIYSKKLFQIVFVSVIVISFLVWIGSIFHQGFIGEGYKLFTDWCTDLWADTLNVMGYSAGKDVYNNPIYGLGQKAYPPLSYIIFYYFSKLVNIEPYINAEYFLSMYFEPRFIIIYFIVVAVSLILLYELIRSSQERTGEEMKFLIAFSVIISQPLISSVERGNTIIWTFFFVLLYILYYDSENAIKKELALISLGIAVAFKITPAALGILLIYNKQWKEIIRTIIYGIVIFFLPFLFFQGGFMNIPIMFRNILLNIAGFSGINATRHGCTLVNCLINMGLQNNDLIDSICGSISGGISVILLMTAFLFKEKWKMILNVCMVLLILPGHVEPYCILYLIPAILLFLREETHPVIDWLYMAAFLLFMWDIVLADGIWVVFDYHLSIVVLLVLNTIQSISNGIKAIQKIKHKDAIE